ncbi:SpoIIE family protein phosphatase [Amycolatopsis sp. QT-25]|uniref:PP2C family protein-serine/threonine phosphatase n=1 Tax=Amycolatopsis sp. QT-25 TaxID=3034022 RepID=UPI0023ECA737|nr:SpoIIE family protein phosphatase [Amycolatopsis sp. QT-25]WET77386.1 SpoIIE family protein phosphatase [Amycolatopsis sp. QT-25]
MSPSGQCPPQQPDDAGTDVSFSALLEDSAEELYENAPCGYLSTLMDGTIAKINGTLLEWLGYRRDEVVGRKRFSDLLSVGGKLYHETHFAPLLHLHGEAKGIALELRTAGRDQLPVLVTSVVKRGSGGEPLLIRTTIFDARERRSYEGELLRGRRIAEEARKHADADRARLRQALAVLQKSLLPAALPQIPNLRSAAHYHTASPDQLGGDFYDLFPLAGGRWAFFLGDVCGKGPEAAAVTSLIRYTLRTTAMHDPDPVATLITLNSVLYQRYTGGDTRFCTTISGTLEAEGDAVRVRLAAGGHPPALVIRADGDADYLPTPGGMLIGFLPDPVFTTAETVLRPGDTMLLYTDGLTEARTGHDRALYGEEALRSRAGELAPVSPEALIADLTDLLDSFGDGLSDDAALLALGVPPGNRERAH